MDRRARYYGFIYTKWYKANRSRLINRLAARRLAINHGLEPGEINQVIRVFTSSREKRFHHKGNSHKIMMKLINMFDQIIKENISEDNEYCSEKN